MATQTIHFEASPGVTSVNLFVAGSDTVIASGASITAKTNDASGFTCTVTDVAAGTYKVVSVSPGAVNYQWVNLDLADGNYVCRENRFTDVMSSTLAVPGSQMDLVNAPNATAVTAIQNGLATATNLAAVKAKTDVLDFSGTAGALKSESTNMRGTDNAALAESLPENFPSLDITEDGKLNTVVTAENLTANNDKTGYELTSDYDASKGSVAATINAGNTGWITVDDPTGDMAIEGFYDGSKLIITDISTGATNTRVIAAHFLSGGDAGFNPDAPFSFTPVAGDTIAIYPGANVTHWRGSAVATPATGGYPAVTLKVGTGSGEINVASGKVPATLANADAATEMARKADIAALNDAVIAAIPSAATNATAVRTNLATELGRIDVAISTRLAPTTGGRTLNVDEIGNVPAAVSEESIRDAIGLEEGDRVATPEDVAVTVTVDPNSAASDDRGSGVYKHMYVSETAPVTVNSVVDSTGASRDLSAIEDLRLIVNDECDQTVQTVQGDELTISGESNDTFSWTPNEATGSLERQLNWALWEYRDSEEYQVILTGTLNVGPVARENDT